MLAKFIEIPTYGLLLISKIEVWNINVVTPDLYQVILYYITIFISRYLYIIFHLKCCNSTQQRVKNILYLIKYKLKPYKIKICIIVLSAMLIIFVINKVPQGLEIYFIDVGQGDSTLIVTPKDKKILIDGGGSSTYDIGENILIPYLLDRKIKKLDYIIISHFDQDHVRRNFSSFKRIGS